MEQLFKSINEHTVLTKSDRERLESSFIHKSLVRRDLLLREGDVCRRLAFIEGGSMYSYSSDKKGQLNVIQFAFEGWWIADLYSYLTGEPTALTIEALEDCNLLMIDKATNDRLMNEIPAYSTYNRILFQNAYVAKQRRIGFTIGLSAEEKYSRFMKEHPDHLHRLPQHLIASYLGMSPETLSRVRGKLSRY